MLQEEHSPTPFTVFNSAWLGVLPFATQGPDNQPGVSIRTSNLPTSVGTYVITEKASLSFLSSSVHISCDRILSSHKEEDSLLTLFLQTVNRTPS